MCSRNLTAAAGLGRVAGDGPVCRGVGAGSGVPARGAGSAGLGARFPAAAPCGGGRRVPEGRGSLAKGRKETLSQTNGIFFFFLVQLFGGGVGRGRERASICPF